MIDLLLHNHDTDAGQTLVLHLNREEAVELVKALSGSLGSNPDDENFSVTLGFTDHNHETSEETDTGVEPDAAV